MADTIPVVDGPMQGRTVQGPGIIYYRFPIPEDFKTAYIAADATTLPKHRYWLYRLEYLHSGATVYRYVGIEENGYPKDSILYAMKELSEGLQEFERILRQQLMNMLPFVTGGGIGRNVGPDYGLPDDCGGLGLTSGKSINEDTSLRVGWRWWLVRDGKLTGVVYKATWPTKGPLEACHMPVDKVPVDHSLFAPTMECQCGIYAREVPSGVHESGLGTSHYALGIAVGWGKVIQHTDGWRARFARPLCIVRPKTKDPVLELVAKSYGVPFVTLSQAYKMGGEFAA